MPVTTQFSMSTITIDNCVARGVRPLVANTPGMKALSTAPDAREQTVGRSDSDLRRGVQPLYGHLSSIGVKVGDRVEKGEVIGRSGMTGLAAGDHLHYTVLVNGTPVNPVEWWDRKWMQDRVFRKIMDAGGSVT